MNKKTVLFVSLALIFLLLLSTNVLAQNILEDIFGPLFGELDVNKFYEDYNTIIDFLIAFIVFLSISQLTITQKFKGRPGTAIAVALAFALSFGFSFFLNQQGIQLRDFGPIAFVVFFLVVGIALYRYFTHWGEGVSGVGALIFLVGYLTTKAIVPGFFDWIKEKTPILNSILQLAFAGALIYTFIVLFRVASKSFRGELSAAGAVAPRPSRRRRERPAAPAAPGAPRAPAAGRRISKLEPGVLQSITQAYNEIQPMNTVDYIALLLRGQEFFDQFKLFVQTLNKLEEIHTSTNQNREIRTRLREKRYKYREFQGFITAARRALTRSGGTTRVNQVRQALRKRFDKEGISYSENIRGRDLGRDPAYATHRNQIERLAYDNFLRHVVEFYTQVFRACQVYQGFEDQLG
jgi:hypothetical protein